MSASPPTAPRGHVTRDQIGPAIVRSMSTDRDSLSLENVTADTFAPFVGHVFEAIDGAGDVHPLTLEACEPGPASPRPREIRQPFSLTFLGTTDDVLPQRIYTVGNAE